MTRWNPNARLCHHSHILGRTLIPPGLLKNTNRSVPKYRIRRVSQSCLLAKIGLFQQAPPFLKTHELYAFFTLIARQYFLLNVD